MPRWLEAALAEAPAARATTIADEAEFQRLYRYLIGQGFEPDQVLNDPQRSAVESRDLE